MNKLSYQYAIKMTRAYPGDIRVFISRVLPILVENYGFPINFEKKTELNRFDWRNMYNRSESHTLGEKDLPKVELSREVYGELQFTDEWESSTLKLINFCPPYIKDTIDLKIDCAESFLLLDMGTHQCTIDLKTDSLVIYDSIMEAIHSILKRFKNTNIQVLETS
ncbi:MAG: hypothetical protein GY810_18475 [Aureispira sp.]|nr:hypothetical protein [Aureispira sp.]